jgi:hypothetical protein
MDLNVLKTGIGFSHKWSSDLVRRQLNTCSLWCRDFNFIISFTGRKSARWQCNPLNECERQVLDSSCCKGWVWLQYSNDSNRPSVSGGLLSWVALRMAKHRGRLWYSLKQPKQPVSSLNRYNPLGNVRSVIAFNKEQRAEWYGTLRFWNSFLLQPLSSF